MTADGDIQNNKEIQNNEDTAVSYLVDALNQAVGYAAYTYVPRPPQTGTDAIRVAMIYKPAKVALQGASMSDGDAVNNRPPMAQAFKAANGARFSVIVNHLKSKGCGGASGLNADQGDGQSCFNADRVEQAIRLRDVFVPQVVSGSGDTDVLVIGDMNSHGFEDPINELMKGGFVNQLERFVRPHGLPYSYVFGGHSAYLDHALVSAGQKLMVIEQGGPRLDALLYVPADSGKEVKLGMEVRLSPSTAKKEEYGSLIGTVIQVDDSPENEAALTHRLGNPDLARLFTKAGPPLQLVVRINPGSGGPDSYAWTSKRSEQIELASTTLVEGQVTVKSGRPISLFIPALRRFVGL